MEEATGRQAAVLGVESSPMDVWVAVTDVETGDESVLGVFSSKEAALAAAERVSSSIDAIPCVLDEVPDWVEAFEDEVEAGLIDPE
jgi:hypothetical protein